MAFSNSNNPMVCTNKLLVTYFPCKKQYIEKEWTHQYCEYTLQYRLYRVKIAQRGHYLKLRFWGVATKHWLSWYTVHATIEQNILCISDMGPFVAERVVLFQVVLITLHSNTCQLGHTFKMHSYKRQDYARFSSMNGKTLYIGFSYWRVYKGHCVFIIRTVVGRGRRRTLGGHRKDSSELHVRGFSGLWLLMEGIESWLQQLWNYVLCYIGQCVNVPVQQQLGRGSVIPCPNSHTFSESLKWIIVSYVLLWYNYLTIAYHLL